MSRNQIMDIKASIQNLFGMRLSTYEQMILQAKQALWQELAAEGIVPDWYRYDITYMAKGAIMVVLYGDAR